MLFRLSELEVSWDFFVHYQPRISKNVDLGNRLGAHQLLILNLTLKLVGRSLLSFTIMCSPFLLGGSNSFMGWVIDESALSYVDLMNTVGT